ncbi:hypothetical protein QYF36_007365 [Acer negundo]|nr:hypothetical protein QYF36_007365 [Acer negundo]
MKDDYDGIMESHVNIIESKASWNVILGHGIMDRRSWHHGKKVMATSWKSCKHHGMSWQRHGMSWQALLDSWGDMATSWKSTSCKVMTTSQNVMASIMDASKSSCVHHG